MAFTSDVLVERTGPGQRQSVKEQGELTSDTPPIPTLNIKSCFIMVVSCNAALETS